MKKIGVFTSAKKLIGITRIPSATTDVLFLLLDDEVKKRLIKPMKIESLELNRERLCTEILSLLDKRKNLPLDIPEYEGRFSEDDIFDYLDFNGEKLKLCNSGKDTLIGFLIRIYNAIETNSELHLFFAQNSREIIDYSNST